MIKRYRDIVGTPVLHFENGSLLGVIKDVIIHPDTGKLEGLWVKPARHLFSYGVVQSQDIVEWKKNCYLKNEGAIAEAGDLIKIAEILSDGRQILNNRVRTEEGASLGKVVDVDFDTKQSYLRQLYVEKRFLFLGYDRRILSYDTIVKVLPEAIIVKDKTTKEEKAKEPLLSDKQIALDS
ncbi:MAG: PRC-barrel domain-containing protein [Candidatus Peregrinibacteria bacterium]